jgi:hypothetical protein
MALLVIGGGGTVLAQQYVLPLLSDTVSAQQEPDATAELITPSLAPNGRIEPPGVPDRHAADEPGITAQEAGRTARGISDIQVSNPYNLDVRCTLNLWNGPQTYKKIDQFSLPAGENRVISLRSPITRIQDIKLVCSWGRQ